MFQSFFFPTARVRIAKTKFEHRPGLTQWLALDFDVRLTHDRKIWNVHTNRYKKSFLNLAPSEPQLSQLAAHNQHDVDTANRTLAGCVLSRTGQSRHLVWNFFRSLAGAKSYQSNFTKTIIIRMTVIYSVRWCVVYSTNWLRALGFSERQRIQMTKGSYR